MRKTASVLFFLLCVVVSIAGAYNVFSDDSEVRATAHELAVTAKRDAGANKAPDKSGAGAAVMTRVDRSPFGQSYVFATPRGDVAITCRRTVIFFGEWRCERD